MKRTKSNLTTTLAPALLTLAVSVAAPAAYAGPIDTVISRVAQVKKDTAYLKTRALQVHVKSNELVQRAQETQSTLNTMIHEADLLKGALAPMKDAFENVRGIRERFQELDFNPADLLHSPEFQDAIEMVRERREAMQERLNDPYIEDFRGEFLETLGQIRSLIAEDTGVATQQQTALETLVSRAPATVLSLIKAAAEGSTNEIRENTATISNDLRELRDLNLMRNFQSATGMKSAYARVDGDEIAFIINRVKSRLVRVTTKLKIIQASIPDTPVKFGVHGYAELIEIDAGKNAKKKVELMLLALERIDARVSLIGETMSLLKD